MKPRSYGELATIELTTMKVDDDGGDDRNDEAMIVTMMG